MKTVNLKADMPTLEVARKRLNAALAEARRENAAAVKLVHGYGSSGAGGVLRDGIRASLRKRRKKGEISGFICGEKWATFDEASAELIERCPQLHRDPDFNNGNEGITIAVL